MTRSLTEILAALAAAKTDDYPDCCMCGDSMTHSPFNGGHQPTSVESHTIGMLELELKAAIPVGYKLLKNSTQDERSWPGDVSDENGSYFNTCLQCDRVFMGYKRRHVCRVCAGGI